MDPLLLRMFMHVAGLMMAAIVAWVLPFSVSVNVAIAAAVFLLDSAVSEVIFNRLATAQQRAGDLRDRADHRP